MNKLKRLCRGEDLEDAKALMVTVPEEAGIAKIEETVSTVKCFGRVHVRSRMFNLSLNHLMVLCECWETFSHEDVPTEVVHLESGEKWQLVTVIDCTY
uniref:Paraneoplastic antigen Ma-like N-terminal domain-containing protein n=1 Tax=Salarias fasciatus TaxID=181472 RepID=A0A672HP40_SALFA